MEVHASTEGDAEDKGEKVEREEAAPAVEPLAGAGGRL